MSEEEKEQELVQEENNRIVKETTREIWNGLHEKTKHFSDARRYIIFSRVVGFMVGNVYVPIIRIATEDAIKEDLK